MPAPKPTKQPEQGIADDASEYENLDAGPLKKRAPSAAKGIAEDAALFEDIVDETTDKARTLESDWTYQKNGQVFGPVKPRDLLELLYGGEIDKDTPIAVSDGEFQPLHRYGVFRVHLPKVSKHQLEVAENKAAEEAAKKARLKRRLTMVAIAVLVAAGAAYGLSRYIQQDKEETARREKAAKEAALLKEIDDLMASVTIEPPLMQLVDDKEAKEDPSGAKKKSRRAVARFSSAPGVAAGGTGELTREEIMAGIGKVFGGIKRCIVEQIQRDPESVPEQVVLSFSIDNEGVPRDVSVDRSLRALPLGSCMVARMAEVRYRKYKGEVQNVEYPITIGRR